MARLTGLLSGYPGDTTRRTTTKELPLGTLAYDELGNEYVYVKAGAAIAINKAVTFTLSALGMDDVVATSAVDQHILGVATTAFASGEYGFVLKRGVARVLATNNIAAGSRAVSGTDSGRLTVIAEGTAGGDAVTGRTKPVSRVVILVTAADAQTNGCIAYFG